MTSQHGPGSCLRHLRLEDSPRAAGQARRAVTSVLALFGTENAEVAEVAALLTSELVTNALRHAAPARRGERSFHLDIHIDGERLRVDVRDPDPANPTIRAVGPDAETGRGLAIVAAEAKEWGVNVMPDGTGKHVWFALPLHPASQR